MKLSALNNVLAKESAVLCAMNTKISFKSLSRSSAKPLSLEQVIDLIDKAPGGSGRQIGTEPSKRREFLRFPITRYNPLHLWLLCLFLSELLSESSEYFTIPCQRQTKSRDYIMA